MSVNFRNYLYRSNNSVHGLQELVSFDSNVPKAPTGSSNAWA